MIDQTISFMWHRTKELYTENLQLKMDAASAAADERAKIVALLRDEALIMAATVQAQNTLLEAAAKIEAGEHLK